MMAVEKVSDDDRMRAAVDRRSAELDVKIRDKRDAAAFRRREAKELDAEADELRDELDFLNRARESFPVRAS
jgi:hypothetical protein